jgi:hypothetical protein
VATEAPAPHRPLRCSLGAAARLVYNKHVKLRTLLCTCLWFALAACQSRTTTADAAKDRLSVDRLYPMRAGSVWTYDVDTGDGPPTLAITRVTASGSGYADVSSGGPPIRYQQRPDGLYRDDRDGYVLKQPVERGARWGAGPDITAEVVDVDKSVSTPAGDFSGCVEVIEQGGEAQKLVRTVFCPDVGPVELESTLTLAVSGGAARVVARLRGYDFSGALGDAP